MPFGKLFGRTPPQKPKLPKSMLGSTFTPPVRKDIKAPDFELADGVKESGGAVAAATGFDPYNSGSFDKRKTWQRVPRR